MTDMNREVTEIMHAMKTLGMSDVLPNSGNTGSGSKENVHEGLVTAVVRPKLKKPEMYKIILLNDDYTPMEFVVHVLEVFFGMAREKAIQIMLAVHTTGKAVCGIYPKDIAETKSVQMNNYAQQNQHPLISQVEPTE